MISVLSIKTNFEDRHNFSILIGYPEIQTVTLEVDVGLKRGLLRLPQPVNRKRLPKCEIQITKIRNTTIHTDTLRSECRNAMHQNVRWKWVIVDLKFKLAIVTGIQQWALLNWINYINHDLPKKKIDPSTVREVRAWFAVTSSVHGIVNPNVYTLRPTYKEAVRMHSLILLPQFKKHLQNSKGNNLRMMLFGEIHLHRCTAARTRSRDKLMDLFFKHWMYFSLFYSLSQFFSFLPTFAITFSSLHKEITTPTIMEGWQETVGALYFYPALI